MSKTTKKSVWVLTYEVNDYDQHGQYFKAVWSEKPTIETLAAYCGKEGIRVTGDVMAQVSFLLHLLNGGGRQSSEDTWYNLDEVECEK